MDSADRAGDGGGDEARSAERSGEELWKSVGLCASCGRHQLVTTTRGSRFYLCTRSREDPAYPRYPRLPMRECPGYESAAG